MTNDIPTKNSTEFTPRVFEIKLVFDSLQEAQILATLLEESVYGETCPVCLKENEVDKSWTLVAVAGEVEFAPLHRFIHDELPHLGLTEIPEVISAPLPDIDWVTENQKSFNAMTIERFYVYNSYVEGDPPEDKVPLLIDASQAFGTGTHPTTEGCLIALDRISKSHRYKRRNPDNVLDMGSGTGILGIAAAKVFGCPVMVVDCDEEAFHVMRDNAKRNEVFSLVQPILSDGFDQEIIAHKSPHEIIFANILAGPLIEMARDLKHHLKSKGRVVLSGILREQKKDVLAAYTAQNLTLMDTIYIGEWVTLVMEGEERYHGKYKP